MLVTDMRPLSMVADEGFRQMIYVFNPGYTLPSRTHFTKLMERKYEQTFQAVKSDIKATQSKIALTTDVWTSVATEAYLGITCHKLETNMKSICLTTMPLEERPMLLYLQLLFLYFTHSLILKPAVKKNKERGEGEDLNSQVRNEVLTYFGEKSLPKEENPLHW